jgi:hypothetical protein
MEFPNKPWSRVLDIPVPAWATHQVDFINSQPDSYSTWIGPGKFQHFRGTHEGGVSEEVFEDDPSFGVKEWENHLLETCSYVKVIDLQPIEENE